MIAAVLAWTGAAYLFALTPQAQAASAGSLIKMSGNPAVYYLGSNMKRYVFPNQKAYNTWYADFSKVVTVSQSELESYPIGGNVTYRAGTRLGKITTDPKVYAVEPMGVLRWITSEQIAMDLFGSNWNQRVDDIPDPFFVNYTVGSDLNSSTFPKGTLVKMANDATIYYVDGPSSKRALASMDAFNANGFQMGHVVETSMDLSGYANGSSISSGEAELSTVAGPEVGSPSTSSTGTLSVSLASDSPVNSTVVANAAQVRFTTLNFTASGGDVTIDKLTVERMNLSQDSNFDAIILWDEDNNEQLGNDKSLGSTHQAAFNDDIVVKNGQTRKISIAANMASTVQAGEVAVLALKSLDLAGSASMTGSLPISGAAMTLNGTISIGTLTIAAGGSNPGASTQKIGTNDYIVSSVRMTAQTEDIWIHKIRFYSNGTASDDDVKNMDLVVDGSVVQTVPSVVDKEVIFNLASPIEIKKGTSKEFTLRLDIVDGSNRTISMDFEKKTDVVAKGETFGFFITPTYPNTTSPYFNGPDTTIDLGALTISKGTLASLNVAEGGTQQVLGAFKFNAQGEGVQITRLSTEVSVSGTGNAADVTNITWYDENGNVVSGPADPGTSGDTAATTTDSFIVPTGIHTYTVKGDLNTDFAQNDTIQLSVDTPALVITAKGDVTNQTITPAPESAVSGDTVTVKVGSLNVSTSATPAAQNVIIGQQGFTFANFTLDASNSGEDVRVTQMALVHRTAVASTQTNLANLQLFDGTTPLNPIVQPSTVAATTATSTFSFTNPVVVPKGTSKTLTLKADVNSGTGGTDTHAFGCEGPSCVTAVGASTANSVTANVTQSAGQTMSLQSSGSLTVADDASNPVSKLVIAGSSKVTMGELRLTATNEDIDLTSIHFTASAVNSGSLVDEFTTLYLFDGATQVASLTPTTSAAATFTINSGDFRIPKGSAGKKLSVKADVANIQTGSPAESGRGVSLAVAQDAYAAKGASSGSTIGSGSMSGTFTGNQFNIFKSLPTVSVVNLSSSSLINGTDIELFKFNLTADSNGDIGFFKATFDIATNTASVTSFKLYEYNTDGSTGEQDLSVNGARDVNEVIVASGSGNSGTHRLNFLFDTGTDGVDEGGEYRVIGAGEGKQYKLKGSISNTVSGSSVSTKLIGDGAFPSTYPNCAGTAAAGCSGIDSDANDSFIWSDLNYGNNSTTATITKEWFNGYRLFSTTTSQTLTK